MMRIVLVVASLVGLCSAGVQRSGVVRSKEMRVPPKGLATQEDLATGFNGAQDLPTMEKVKVETDIKQSVVVKAGDSGPSFDHDENSSDHPNVVDSIPYEKHDDFEIPVLTDSGSSIPMFLFLVCGGSVVAWLYTTEQRRTEVKDKAGAVMQMFGPLVQDAMAAMGVASAAANSLHSSYKKVGSDDEDDLMRDEHKEEDPYNPSAGMESQFLDRSEDAPDHVEQGGPPLDLFADGCTVPPPALDLFDPNEASEPQTLDSMGLLDTDNTESNKFDLGF